MTDPKITLDLARLEALLDAYGPDPAHFPESERDAAHALLARDPVARALLADAAALAGALDALPAPLPSPALQRAVAEIPLRNPQLGTVASIMSAAPALGSGTAITGWLPFRSPSRALLSAMMVLLLGVLSGVWSAGSESESGADVAAPAADADDWHDLSALTFATDLDKELEP